MAMHRKGCTKIERVFGEDEKSKGKGHYWNKVGMQYGELIVEEKLDGGYYLCACSCGNYLKVKTSDLRDSISKSKTHCGCLTTKYEKDENYFEKIDTEEKAYILGFLATDGCIGKSGSSKRIKITLNYKDYELLNRIAKEFKSEIPIREYNISTKLPQGTFCNSRVCEINICSNKICEDLEKYGIHQNKTYNMLINLELIPNNLIRHFVRGVIDGDGSFGIYCNDNLTKISYDAFRLTGNKYFLEQIKNIMEMSIPGLILKEKENGNGISELYLNSKTYFIDIQNYLYNDSCFYLKRKYDKHLKCIELINDINRINSKNNLSLLSKEEKEELKNLIKTKGSNDYPVRE